VVNWQKDEQSRDFAAIPGFGDLVRLTSGQEKTARAKVAAKTDPVSLVFEISFLDGNKALFMSKAQSAAVEGESNGNASSSA
jgi:hypothetical protein